MSATVEECCYGRATHHRGKGRCAADQGGRTAELKFTNLVRDDEDVYELDGEEIPVFEIDPDIFGMDCVNMVDCMGSTDPCGNQIPPTGVGVTHILVNDPFCDRGRLLLALKVGDDFLTEAPEDLCLWLRVYG